jgi:hypothetical protein
MKKGALFAKSLVSSWQIVRNNLALGVSESQQDTMQQRNKTKQKRWTCSIGMGF